jgi:cobalt-zinc-cadmium efflux system protein
MNGNNLNKVFFLTLIFFVIELIGGLYCKSLALLTDAAFMATNVAGQLIAIFARNISNKAPDKTKTFGYERAKVLAGLFNGMLVGFVLFYVFTKAY